MGGKTLLIDAGPDFRQQALLHKIDHLDGLLLTHTHFDHIAGIDELRVYYLIQKKPLLCLLSKESFEELKVRYHYLFRPLSSNQSLTAQIEVQVLPHKTGEADFAGFKIGYFSYFQSGMEVTGYRLGSFAYVSDIRDFDEAIFGWLSGVKTLVVSAIRAEPSKMMFSIDEAIDFARAAGVKETFLMHMNHEVDYHAVNPQLPSGVHLAYDGLEVAIGI